MGVVVCVCGVWGVLGPCVYVPCGVCMGRVVCVCAEWCVYGPSGSVPCRVCSICVECVLVACTHEDTRALRKTHIDRV